MDEIRNVSQGSSKTPYSPNKSGDFSKPVKLEAPLAEDEDSEDEGFPHEHVPLQDDSSLDSSDGDRGLRQDFHAPRTPSELTGLLDDPRGATGHSSSEEPFENTPMDPEINKEGRLGPMGKGEGKAIHPLKLDLSDKITSDSPSLPSRQSSETTDVTPTATGFSERMKGHFARMKSKDVAAESAALPATTSPTHKPEEQLEWKRSEQARDDEGFGPREMPSSTSDISVSSSSSANLPSSQHQHNEDETCCTCDNEPSQGDRPQPTESKREPWRWVMQVGFCYLVYCVYCDFATAVHHGSQLSRRYGQHIIDGHGSFIVFTSWWRFFRFVLGIMYLGSWLSSGAAWSAVDKVTVWIDRGAAWPLLGNMEQQSRKAFEAVQSVVADAKSRLGKIGARGSKA